MGVEVTLVDADPNPGGVCTFRGCIPSKALLHAAHVIEEAKHAEAFGLSFDRLRSTSQRFAAGKTPWSPSRPAALVCSPCRKVEFIQGRASIVNARTLSVATSVDERRIETDYIIIAAGSRPAAVTGITVDSPKVLDSTTALDVPDVPKRQLVVGGGYIGLEFGTVYAALGSRVSVVEMTDGLLPSADRDPAAIVAKRMGTAAEAILLETRVTSVNEDRNGLSVTFEGKHAPDGAQTFDRVLVAVGRKPNSLIAGLDKTHVTVNQRGFIEVDRHMRTAEPSIFAIGDVVGDPKLAHKASHEARVAVDVIQGRPSAFEPRAIPAVVFTDPELAWTGLTEAEARKHNILVDVAKFPWTASGAQQHSTARTA
jgi:dihydrolipoamide dehydrogenase